MSAGVGVAGYLNSPDPIAGRFVVNPFGEGLLYRTGDMCTWRADGTLEFISRGSDRGVTSEVIA